GAVRGHYLNASVCRRFLCFCFFFAVGKRNEVCSGSMIVDTSKRDNSATEVKNGQTRLSRRIQGRRGPAGSGAAIFFRASVRGDGCWRHRLAALGGAVARAKGGSSAHGRSDKRGRAAHQRARNAGSRSGKGARDPKKIHGLLRERNGSLIEVIHSLKKAYPIASMCALVGVARS